MGESMPASKTAAAPPAAEMASPAMSGDMAKKDSGEEGEPTPGPKTWKRAGAATHAARIAIGDKETLPLRGMQFKVEIDGFRARVVLDAYFENDRDRAYEGNFQLRLPDDATPYFFAFGETDFERRPAAAAASDPASKPVAGPRAAQATEPQLEKAAFFPKAEQQKLGTSAPLIMAARAKTWHNPKEARIVPREKAAFAFTETTRAQADPALLEWAGAGIFNARVFPIAAHKIHRVVLAYDVSLVRAGKDFEYRLELPDAAGTVSVDVSTSGPMATEPKLAADVAHGRSYFHAEGARGPAGGDHALTFRASNLGNPVLTGGDPKVGPTFTASVVPALPARAASTRDEAVFLVDTSLSSNPDRFNVFMKLLAANLENNRSTLKRFNVLFFDVQTTWWRPAWVDNTKENAQRLLAEMNTLTLEGATDIGAALAASQTPPGAESQDRFDTFLLSDGAATWGESDKNIMAHALTRGPLFAYQTGLAGTDGAALARFARESGGAVFSVVGEEEIAKASTAHRARPFRLVSVKGSGADDLVVAGRPRTIYPGQALFLGGRGAPKDMTVTVEQDGKETPVRVALAAAIESPLAPRAYGQIATSVLEEMGKATEAASRAYAIHYRVVGETCSLVMLESEADYARFGIQPEREAERVKAELASVVAARADAALQGSLADPKAYMLRWLDGLAEKPGMKIAIGEELRSVVRAMPESAFVVKPKALEIKARTKNVDAPPRAYAVELATPGKLSYDAATAELQARRGKYGAGDALRALSSLVEQTPGDAILARDVGFSAMELGLPAHAFYLFRRVADARPWEPQSYRAMADVLGRMGMTDLAMIYYEVSMLGEWNPRFGEFRKIAAVDYVRFLRRVQKGELKTSAPAFAERRLVAMNEATQLKGADLVVMITWNTDNSDVDLHVTEPNGEECFYQHRSTSLGGELTQDVTQGYGPEMYVMKRAASGSYQVRAKYFTSQRNRASARTKVYAQVIEGWGTPQERVTEKNVTLAEGKEMHDIVQVTVTAKSAPMAR